MTLDLLQSIVLRYSGFISKIRLHRLAISAKSVRVGLHGHNMFPADPGTFELVNKLFFLFDREPITSLMQRLGWVATNESPSVSREDLSRCDCH